MIILCILCICLGSYYDYYAYYYDDIMHIIMMILGVLL